MGIVKILFGIIYWFIILSLVIIAASTALSVLKIPGGISLFIVQSGSMEPTINTGSVVLIQKQDNYKKGDIITFFDKNKSETTTHRILATKKTSGEKIFATKGDANRGADREIIKENQILGKMIFFVPYLGNAVSFAKTQAGFIFLIIVPAVIIIISEILNIKKELLKIIEKRKMPKDSIKILTFLLLIGAILMFSTSTKAYLSDKEESNNNVLQAGTWGIPEPSATPTATPTVIPTPTPILGIANHIVISEVQITGGPGNTTHDFIELYNPTSSSYDLNGHRLVKRSGNSPNDNTIKSWTTSTTISAHGFYLWASSDDSSFPVSIGADTSTTDTLAANNSIALRNGPENTGTLIDVLSWNDGSTLVEGDEFDPNPGENQSMERKAFSTSTVTSMAIGGADEFKGNGYDTNNNATNFVLRSLSQPQNSANTAEMP
ncbi:MAG: signal peptidase I [Candidatus Levybacteria bacterium]|nr:signal peptidase I [Candidatus Levybacteria bacterium]